MRILRALGALLPLALAAASLLLTPIPSVAQEPAVALTQKAQTPLTTLEKPEVTITTHFLSNARLAMTGLPKE